MGGVEPWDKPLKPRLQGVFSILRVFDVRAVGRKNLWAMVSCDIGLDNGEPQNEHRSFMIVKSFPSQDTGAEGIIYID